MKPPTSLFCKTVSTSNAHRSTCGKKGADFEEAYSLFLGTVPTAYLSDHEPPTQKGVEGRFKIVFWKRRKEVRRSAATSEVPEKHGETEILLDDLILEIEKQIEEEKEKKGKRLEKEQKLEEAGKEVRNLALKRIKTSGVKSGDHISPGATRGWR